MIWRDRWRDRWSDNPGCGCRRLQIEFSSLRASMMGAGCDLAVLISACIIAQLPRDRTLLDAAGGAYPERYNGMNTA